MLAQSQEAYDAAIENLYAGLDKVSKKFQYLTKIRCRKLHVLCLGA